MDRLITVRGTGAVSLKPDRIELPVTLSLRDMDYAILMARSEEALAALRAALAPLGFGEEDLRTQEFSVSPVYDGVRDESTGGFRQVFAGYECRHGLRLGFPLDLDRLSAVLAALAACPAAPEFGIQFTVQDREAAKTALLAAAARDAREKAEALCAAAGAALGRLVRIDYGVREERFYSATSFTMDAAVPEAAMKRMSFTPEDVRAADSAGFVWELL